MIRSLRARLLLSILLPLLLIVPMVGWVLSYLLQTQVFVASVANELIRQAVLVADLAGASVEIWRDPTQAESFVARVSPRLTAKLMLLDPQGHLIVSSDPRDAQLVGKAYEMPDMQRLLAQETPVEIQYAQSQISDVYVPAVDPSGRLIGVVRLTNPLASLYVRSERLGWVTLSVVVGGLVLGLILGLLLARDVERPLKQTSLAVYELASGQQPLEPLREEGPVEIRRLVKAFNELAERLKNSEESRRQLLANMVHELGRPLGALLSGLQALRGGAAEDAQLREELLEGMENEIILLQHLLNDLAHLEQGRRPIELHPQVVQLAEWLPAILSPWAEEAAKKNLRWDEFLPAELPAVSLDSEKLAQALGNLVSNAIRYTPAGGNIRITAQVEGEALQITVADSGPGILPEERERIFQPFCRGSSARHFSEGMGLGLTIARDLARAHGGDILLESQPGQGSRFTIQIPLS